MGETHIGTVVGGEDRLAGIDEKLGAGVGRFFRRTLGIASRCRRSKRLGGLIAVPRPTGHAPLGEEAEFPLGDSGLRMAATLNSVTALQTELYQSAKKLNSRRIF